MRLNDTDRNPDLVGSTEYRIVWDLLESIELDSHDDNATEHGAILHALASLEELKTETKHAIRRLNGRL